MRKNNFAVFAMLLIMLLAAGCQKSSSVEALGTLERDRVILKSPANEIIMEEPVAEGEMVKQGDVIVRLDERRQKAVVARAEAQVAIANAQFDKLRNGARKEDIDVARSKVSAAKAVLVAAEKDYKRNHSLKKQGLISQESLDRSIANRDTAQTNLRTVTEQLLALTNGSRQEELDQAEASIAAAQAQLELEQIRMDELTVTASRNGYLDSLPYHVGERVSTGAPLAVLLAGEQPYARVYVPETWRVKLKVGDALMVRVDGIESALSGHLRWIDTAPSFTPYYALNAEDRSRLVYLAEIELDDGQNLPSGVPAQLILE
ncbi:MAG: HlyD family secretion protein [bacterium]